MRTHLGVQAGKDSYLRLIELDTMSGPLGSTGGELFVDSVAQGYMIIAQPLVWTNPATGAVMLIVANHFGISATEVFVNPANGNQPELRHSGPPNWVHTGVPVPGSVTTAGGTSPVLANGVLYYAGSGGVLALDPASGATSWSDASMGAANSTTKTSFHKQSLIVSNARIYVADDHGKLWVYQSTNDIFANGFRVSCGSQGAQRRDPRNLSSGNVAISPPRRRRG